MKLSVVMSTYNGASFIQHQLESLRDQKRKADEVLIFDDCSSDNTVDIARNFISKNRLGNWKIVVNEHNKGWRKNFIDGMAEANGDLIFPCDQDDYWHDDKLEIMSNFMNRYPQIKVLASNYREVFDDGTTHIGSFRQDNQLKKVELYNNYMLNKLPGCTFCIRKEIAQLCKKYWEKGYPHDALIWRLGLFSDSLYIYAKDLIDWRKHGTSAFAREAKNMKNKESKYDWIETSARMNTTIQRFINEYPVPRKDEKQNLLAKTAYYLLLRKKLYNTENPLFAIRLARYWNLYPRYRQYLADWYLVYVKK